MRLLQNKNILDSGATDHIFYNKDLLTSLKEIRNDQYVLVANGMKTKIDGTEEIELFSTKLKNILYISSFLTNLISITKLTQELNCNSIFSSINIIFQDREIGKIIGEGMRENGLYFLKIKEK
jgi:hypothetical protein